MSSNWPAQYLTSYLLFLTRRDDQYTLLQYAHWYAEKNQVSHRKVSAF